MLKMAVLLVGLLLLTVMFVAMVATLRDRRRRRAMRSRRKQDYAARGATWRTYLHLNRARGVRRLTDQSRPDD